MKNLVARTERCASCHVGSATSDVDHELIAAGHPRLNFEVGSHHVRLARHWREKGDNATADFEARLWAIGQLVSAREALKLLEYRASAKTKTWPEFAEYDCLACHHALHEPSARPPSSGRVPWSNWYFALLPAVEAAAEKTPSLEELREEMRNLRPDRTRVKELAGRAASEVGACLSPQVRQAFDTKTRRERMRQLLKTGGKGQVHQDWDSAAQLYLGLAAYERCLHDPQLRAVLLDLRKLLLLPKDADSPKNYKLTQVQDLLQEFRKQLEK
jgi:hypothetical protein